MNTLLTRSCEVIKNFDSNWFIVKEPLLNGESRRSFGRSLTMRNAFDVLLKETNLFNSGNNLGELLNLYGFQNLGGNVKEKFENADNNWYLNFPKAISRGLKFTGICNQQILKNWYINRDHLAYFPLMDIRLFKPIMYFYDSQEIKNCIKSGSAKILYESIFKVIQRPVHFNVKPLEVKFTDKWLVPIPKLIIIGESRNDIPDLYNIEMSNKLRNWVRTFYPKTTIVEVTKNTEIPFYLTGDSINIPGTSIPVSGENRKGYYGFACMVIAKQFLKTREQS